MASNGPKFLVHDSQGIHLWSVANVDIDGDSKQQNESVQLERTLSFETKPISIFSSNDCKFLVITFKTNVQLFSYSNIDKPLFEFNLENVNHVWFSPKSTILMLYAPPKTSSNNDNDGNLKLFNTSNGELIHQWFDKKREIIQWSSDETIAHRMVGSEILFYENNDFTKCTQKIVQQKITKYAFATNKAGCNYIAVFIKGQKGSPSTIRVHSYPHLENSICSKSFYKVDSIEIKWNPKGDAMLVLASTDHDSSGKSYYGETMLHFLDLHGESQTITDKQNSGTVSAAEWLSNNDGFIVIQGKVPSLITWYNNRAEKIFSFGDAPVNGIHLNPFGNLIAFIGTGNLSGNVYIWNMKTKTLISNFRTIDATCFFWLADGQHIITATHFDRLRVANGFRLWNYLGTMKHQHECSDDSQIQLFKIFSFDQKERFNEPQISADVKGKLLCAEPVKKYIPPSLKNKLAGLTAYDQKKITKPPPPLPNPAKIKDPQLIKEKQIKNLQKKLQQIEQLKKLQKDGKQLEKNQLDKIEKEKEILEKIAELQTEV